MNKKNLIVAMVIGLLIIVDIALAMVIVQLCETTTSQQRELVQQKSQLYKLQSENEQLKDQRDELLVDYFKELTKSSELVVTQDGIYSDIVPLSEDLQIYTYNKCVEYNVPYALVLGLIEQESDFNVNEVSTTNDYGLCQINACNFDFLNEEIGMTDIMDPYQNIESGIYMLSYYHEKYSKDEPWSITLVQYNMGPSGAKKLFATGKYSTNYSNAVIEKSKKYEDIV
jgi:soluble lytic murein transglycosylase-like protein